MSAPTDEPAVVDDLVDADDGALTPGRSLSTAPPAGARCKTPRRRGAPLPVAAAVAVLWAAVLGLLPVLVLAGVSVIGAGATFGGVLRTGAGVWLLGQFVPVELGGSRITLVPLAVTIWVGWRLLRAGVHASRATGAHRARSLWPAVRAGLAVGLGYALVGLLVCAATGTAGGHGWRIFGTLAGLAAGLALAGAVGGSRAGRRLWRRVPSVLGDAVRAGSAAVALLLAAGAAAAGLALALHGGAAADTLGSYRAGLAGQLGITAGCLAFVPNLAVWSAGYLLGPGFSVGVGTVVSPADVLTGPVPVLPVLAALPSGPLSGVGPALLGVPLAAGIAAGLLIARRGSRSGGGWGRLLGSAALAGPVAGVLVQGAVVASRGGLGTGRLAVLGVVDPRVALLAAGVISLGALVGAACAAVLRRS